MLSPLKRTIWSRLHCQSCLKLLKKCFFFILHIIFPTLTSWTFITNIFNSDVGKYYKTQKMWYSWLWREWINSQKLNFKWRKKQLFYVFFLLLFYPFYYLLFFKKEKEAFLNIFTFNRNSQQIKYIVEKNKTQKKIKMWMAHKKINTGPQIFSGIFWYKIGFVWPDIKINMK
jgi:hypothetical protein